MTAETLTAVALAYLTGTLPFGLLAGWISSRRDVRRHGSGSTGATNVLRTAGWVAASATLLLDAAKGATAVLLARMIAGEAGVGAALAAPAVVAGAIWPPWLRFRGGKGVASGAGALAILAPLPLILSLAAFLATVAITRWISVGSAAAATAFPFVAAVLGSPRSTVIAGIGIWGLILWSHRGNWARVSIGTEPRWPFRRRDRGSERP